MARDIDQWLEGLGFGKYAEVFAENDIGPDVLPHLTEEHLKELGVSLGDRVRLLMAIEALEATQADVPEASPPSELTASVAVPAGEAERRQLTVMFCDLVVSTELSTRLDPEDLREVIRAYQDACAKVIAQYNGYIAKYMGDGVLVYFGYPQAHENDAERAARTGLGIVETMADVGAAYAPVRDVELAVRVGIDTGLVVVGDIVGEGASEEASVVGETPNVAARLQALARPNQVVIGPLTRELIGGAFACEDLGEHHLKGIAEPVQAWRVVREGDEAGCTEEAVAYSQKAGQIALGRSANVEAVSHFNKALELLPQLPEIPERHERELEIQMALGPALVAARGFADAGVGHAYARAWELCQRLEDNVHLPLVLRGRQVFHLLSGELNKAREFAKQFLDLAERQQDPALLVGSYHALGQTLFFLGDLIVARRTVEQGIDLFDPEQHRVSNWPGGQPGEQCYLYDAFALWMLGYPDEALQRSEEALALAEQLANPANLINTLAFVAIVHALRRELSAGRQRAEVTMEMSAEQRNPFFLGMGTVLHGWAQTAQDQGEDGIAEIDQGITTFRATGARTWLPYLLGLQAEIYARAKRTEDGLASVAEALALTDKTEEHCWQAELNRIEGELLLVVSSDNHAEAENCFSQAMDIARRQQAKSWELRTAVSLGRLWQQQGKVEEAHKMLSEIYGWFTEGFDTLDLKEAKALLDDLMPPTDVRVTPYFPWLS